MQKVKVVLKDRKAQTGTVISTAMTVVILICVIVCGLFIVYAIEDAMLSTGNFTQSDWYTIYQNFVDTITTVFNLLPVAIIVVVAGFVLAILMRWVFGGRGGGR